MKVISKWLFFFFLFAATNVQAQKKRIGDGTVREVQNEIANGYWVVESNVRTPRSSIVHFYDNNGREINTEKVEGIFLNCRKKKVRITLDVVLKNSLFHEQDSLLKTKVSVAELLTKN